MRRALFEFLADAKRLSAEEFVAAHRCPVLVPIGLDTSEIVTATSDRTGVVLREQRHTGPLMGPHALAGQVLVLDDGSGMGGSLYMGRLEENDVVVPDSSVSLRHCCLQATPTGVTVLDLGSTNGTLLNGEQLIPHMPSPVSDEDVITFGRYRFQLLYPPTFYVTLREMLGELPVA